MGGTSHIYNKLFPPLSHQPFNGFFGKIKKLSKGCIPDFLWYYLGMFTGIIEETGLIKGFTKHSSGADLIVECKKVLEGVKLGDSICVNGCCQTVVDFDKKSFTVNLSQETLKVTNFLRVKIGDVVNLERAVTPTSRMGGHIVQGHIDGVGHLLKVEKNNDYYDLYFEVEPSEAKYLVYKGSVAVNGVSLTVADLSENVFKTAVIPHTMDNTNFKNLQRGDVVNIETDILGRYIEKFLYVNNNNNTINEKFLMENGFI